MCILVVDFRGDVADSAMALLAVPEVRVGAEVSQLQERIKKIMMRLLRENYL